MLPPIEHRIAVELGVRPAQVKAAVQLLDEGATVPFISGYRKEATDGLDDTQLRTLEELLTYLRELEERRAAIVASIEEQGKMTPELKAEILQAETKQRLETARELIVKGRELHDKGDLAGALEKLRAAHALAHTPITGIELARTHVALKQPLEARDVCLGIGRMPVTREETSRSKEARDEAAQIAEDMRPKIASITVKVKAPADRAVVVKIDDVNVPVAGLEGRKVNPGKHVVTARIDEGKESRADVEVSEGGTKEIALEPEVPKAVARRPDESPTVPKPSEWVEEKRISPLVPIGFAVGAAPQPRHPGAVRERRAVHQ